LGFVAGVLVDRFVRRRGKALAPSSDFWRKALLATSILIFVSVVGYGMFLLLTTPAQIKVVNYDVYRTEALKMQREESAGFVQIGIAVLGALWATMVVSKDNRLRSTDRPEITMFMTATLLLLFFLFFNWSYERLLAQLYWDMGPTLSAKSQFADVLNSRYVQARSIIMHLCFYGGLVLSALAVLSCCLFRKEP